VSGCESLEFGKLALEFPILAEEKVLGSFGGMGIGP
jgi:hypothetical protein